jgi:hypothetical protein
VRQTAMACPRSWSSALSVVFAEKGERNTYLGKVAGFSNTVALALEGRALLCERVDALPTIRAYPPMPSMTFQLTSFTFTTSTTSGTGNHIQHSRQPHQHFSRHACARPKSCAPARSQAPISPRCHSALSRGPYPAGTTAAMRE